MADPMTNCAKCGGATERGFIVDYTHGGMTQSSWVLGEPVKSWWMGLKLPSPRYPIVTTRCTMCGFLESFALYSQ